MLIFVSLFVYIGTYAPLIYSKYTSSSTYYIVYGLAQTDKKTYKPCETVQIVFSRWSGESIEAKLHIELINVRDNGAGEVHTPRDEQWRNGVFLGRGVQEITTSYTIPCDISPKGEYYIRRTLIFYVDQNKKDYKYFTNRFIIGGGEQQ